MNLTTSIYTLLMALTCLLPVSARLTAAEADPAEPAETAAAATSADDKTATGDTMAADTNETEQTVSQSETPARRSHDAIVRIGNDVELKADQTAEVVVVIGGNAKIHGKVTDAVVVIGGNIEVDGEVGDAVVAVLGNIHAKEGAKVRGEAVAVAGKVAVDSGAKIEGQTQELDFGGALTAPKWLKDWFLQCVLKMRPLAPQVPWVWGVFGAVWLLYLLIALVFPRPVQVCVDEIARRPATTVLIGILAKILVPIIFFILLATGIGVFVIPFVFAALFFGAMLGKVALLQGFGQTVLRRFGAAPAALLGFLIGSVIIVLLYMVPVLGLLTYGVLSVWGLGVAVTAAFGGMRKEMPEKTAPISPVSQPSVAPSAPLTSPSISGPVAENPLPAASFAPSAEEPGQTATAMLEPAVPPIVPAPLAYPKAGFWERMGAAFLDTVLVSVLGAIMGGPPWLFLVALAYFSGMWAWRGTTIGGIVLGLKVVRVDSQPVTFTVALVRALSAAFSIVVLFLGFLWIAWDGDKQGWHDKIAGTIVIKLPKATPLVCI